MNPSAFAVNKECSAVNPFVLALNKKCFALNPFTSALNRKCFAWNPFTLALDKECFAEIAREPSGIEQIAATKVNNTRRACSSQRERPQRADVSGPQPGASG